MTRHDQERLDEIFDDIVDRLHGGQEVDVSDLCPDELELEEDVGDLVQLARLLNPSRPWGPPRVPGYQILGELGRGGMGIVWLAHQERASGRKVALKTLPSGLFQGKAVRERISREARALAATVHPNIVVLYETVETETVFAYAMEWVEGTTLAGEIRAMRGRAERDPSGEGWETRVCRMGVLLAQALEVLHGLGIVHRDVKPSNVLLRRDGTPVLSDLGLALLNDSTVHTLSGAFVGTPAYASPEQLRGEHAHVDARSDVYSLGATLFHALAFRPAFPAATAPAALEAIEQVGALPVSAFPSNLSPELRAILSKAMDPERERRYPSAQAFADDLQRVLDLRPVLAQHPSRAYRLRRFLRRNRRSVGAGIAGLVLATVAAVLAALTTVVLPRYVADHVLAARLALLNPTHMEHVLVWRARLGGEGELTPSKPVLGDERVLERYRVALDEYDRALRWGGSRPDIRAEREAVEIALGLLSGDDSARVPEAQRGLLAGLFAREWSPDRWVPVFDSGALELASQEERRTAGLVAYLCGATEDCDRAWLGIQAGLGGDPFLDGTLGLVLQNSQRSALAYPRLLSACLAYPGQDFLWIQLADAAFQVGDLDQSSMLLDKARGGADPFDHRRLVEADLAAASGDWALASRLSALATREHKAARSRLHGALSAFIAGDHSLARLQTVALTVLLAGEQMYGREAAWLLRRWWFSLSPERRLDHVLSAWEENPRRVGSLASIIRLCRRERAMHYGLEVEQPRPGMVPWRVPASVRQDWVERVGQSLRLDPSWSSTPPPEGLVFTRLLIAKGGDDGTGPGLRRAAASLALGLDALLWALWGRALEEELREPPEGFRNP